MKYREDWYRKDILGGKMPQLEFSRRPIKTSSILSKPGYYDSPENLGKYGVSYRTMACFILPTRRENLDASIYARRLGQGGVLRDTRQEIHLTGTNTLSATGF